MGIGHDCLPRRGKDVPRCRYQSAPLRRPEKKHNINETGKHPATHTPKVPVAAQTEVVLAGQRHYRRDWRDFVLGGPKLVLRRLFPGQPEPFTSAQGVVTPKYADDTRHVAACTVPRHDSLIRWNFRHLVNVQRSAGFNSGQPVAGLAARP